MNATYLLLDRLFAHERRRFSADKRGYSHRRRREKLGHYPFIPRDIDHAMCMIMAAKTYLEKTSNRRSGKFKFLDAGCGVGNIVMLAYAAGFDAYGVEYDPKTLEWGKSLFEQFLLEPERLMQGDILEFNNYADYDVIYAYCPMLKGELERRFEEKAAQEAKPGAVIIGFHPSNMYFKDKRPNVILKQYSLHIVENDSCYTTMLVKA